MLGERPKTAEELNAELYEKVSTEFEEYKNNLLMLPPEQLLEHAYAYAVRSDIVIAIECGSIHARQGIINECVEQGKARFVLRRVLARC